MKPKAITYRVSLDTGRHVGPVIRLGGGHSLTFPADATVIARDVYMVPRIPGEIPAADLWSAFARAYEAHRVGPWDGAPSLAHRATDPGVP